MSPRTRSARRGLLLAGLASPWLLQGCNGDYTADPAMGNGAATLSSNEVLAWNDIAMKAIRQGTLGPPMVARALAMLFTATYDAWTAYDPVALPAPAGGMPARLRSLAGTPPKNEAIAYAAHAVLVELFPAQQAEFDRQLAARGLAGNRSDTDPASPAQVGLAAAAACIASRRQDGANQLGDLAPGAYADYTGYQPVNTLEQVNDPTRWQPLRYSNGKAPAFMAPHWGRVRPFALASGDALRAAITLPAYGSVAYRDQVDEVLALTAALDDRTKTIAEYWANGPNSETPPGHWCLFAAWVSARDGHSVDDDARLFFMLGNAMLDASINCWDNKRFYDAVRPITAIRTLYAGQTTIGLIDHDRGIGSMPGQSWMPYQLASFVTPPFAEFTSGHSTFSAAGAQILKRFTGSDRFGASASAAPGSAQHQAGVPSTTVTLTWDSFSAAADEAGMSRLYGGIHFATANTLGNAAGRRVADAVWDRAQRLFSGAG